MFKYIFIFICCFSIFLFEDVFYPMKKDSKLGEHIYGNTEYFEDHNSKTYVKPYEEEKYYLQSSIVMSGTSTIEKYFVCKNFTNQFQIKVYNEEFTYDFECDDGLKCNSNKMYSRL